MHSQLAQTLVTTTLTLVLMVVVALVGTNFCCEPFSCLHRKAYCLNWLQEKLRILHQGLLVTQTPDMFLPCESDENKRLFESCT